MLITHNAVNGVLQAGGCIAMRDLKDEIKILNAKGAKVFLITDACRSNENAYDWNKTLFTDKIANKSSGEFQFISCSSDEKSFEDVRWGGGHGVFTYHLIEGWIGLADEDDGWVSVGELVAYVKAKVKGDTYDPKLKKTLQKPHHCCTDQEDWIVGKVDEEMKKRILVQKEMGNNQFAALMPNMRTKDAELTRVEDTLLLRYYQKFYFALDDKRFLYPENDCAYHYYKLLKNAPKATSLLADVEIDLRASMANEAQYTIQEFLTGMDTVMASSNFRNSAALMNAALAMMDTTDQLYANMKARALFLEAGGLMDSQDKMVQAFYKLDSSLVFEPGAPYVYYMRAKIYEEFKYHAEAENNYLKAIELAPRWIYPLIGIGYFYAETGKIDKSLEYYQKALAIRPRPHTHNLIAYSYYSKKSYPEALKAYNSALELDPGNPASLCGMGTTFMAMGEADSAYAYYLKALERDSFFYYTYAHIGSYFYKKEQNKRAIEFYDYSVKLNPSYKHGHYMLGVIHDLEGEPVKAVENYLNCLRLDKFDTDIYERIGNLLLRQKLNREALEYFTLPVQFDNDYNPVGVGEAYLKLNVIDSAIAWLQYSDENFPDKYRTLSLLGSAYQSDKQFSKSINYFRKSAELKPDYAYNDYAMAVSHYYLNQKDSAAFYYQLTLTKDSAYRDVYTYLWSLYFYDLNQKEQALEVLEKGLKQFPKDEDLLYFLLYHYLESDKPEKALEYAEISLNMSPYSARNHFGKAMCLSALNKTIEALDALDKAIWLGIKPTPENWEIRHFDPIRNQKRFRKIVQSSQKANK